MIIDTHEFVTPLSGHVLSSLTAILHFQASIDKTYFYILLFLTVSNQHSENVELHELFSLIVVIV